MSCFQEICTGNRYSLAFFCWVFFLKINMESFVRLALFPHSKINFIQDNRTSIHSPKCKLGLFIHSQLPTGLNVCACISCPPSTCNGICFCNRMEQQQVRKTCPNSKCKHKCISDLWLTCLWVKTLKQDGGKSCMVMSKARQVKAK